jgi:hypothetical protein
MTLMLTHQSGAKVVEDYVAIDFTCIDDIVTTDWHSASAR